MLADLLFVNHAIRWTAHQWCFFLFILKIDKTESRILKINGVNLWLFFVRILTYYVIRFLHNALSPEATVMWIFVILLGDM